MKLKLLLSCEHATNKVPKFYEALFTRNQSILSTHRGWDIGALHTFKHLKKTLPATGFSATISRLLIDINRSLKSPSVFSEYSNTLSDHEKKRLIAQYYEPYRCNITQHIRQAIAEGFYILHFSIHTFTPVFKGVKRKADIGFLYDPSRLFEKKICRQLKTYLQHHEPDYTVRCNYPYKGTADGFTTTLRKVFPKHYAGIEIESNQCHFTSTGNVIDKLPIILGHALLSLNTLL